MQYNNSSHKHMHTNKIHPPHNMQGFLVTHPGCDTTHTHPHSVSIYIPDKSTESVTRWQTAVCEMKIANRQVNVVVGN